MIAVMGAGTFRGGGGAAAAVLGETARPCDEAAGVAGFAEDGDLKAAASTGRHFASALRYGGLFVLTPFRVSACEPLADGSCTPLLRRQVAKVESACLNCSAPPWPGAGVDDGEALEAGALGCGDVAAGAPATRAWATAGVDAWREEAPQAASETLTRTSTTADGMPRATMSDGRQGFARTSYLDRGHVSA
jgi:hypothetical protein